MFWIIIFSFVVLMGLAIAIYLLPEQTAKAKKKKEKKAMLMAAAVVDTSKDWKAIAERWEKHNQSLQGAIEKMNMDQKNVQLQIDGHKAQIKDMGEKLALEKSWREKEQMSLEKLKAHEKDFQSQISRTESELEKEHSHRMRLEREYQELKIKHDQIVEEKRQLSVKAASQQTTLEAATQEIKALKSDNTQLKEKRADIQWVAKSEFDQLKQLLQAKEKDLARLKESHG